MKVSYFGYSILKQKSDQQYLFDLRPFIRAFVQLDDVKFKSQFSYADESLFLLPVTDNLYLFLMTRTNEIIRKIKSSDLSVTEIYDLLSADEQIGFASYVYMGASFLGFASTVMAPRSKTFSVFLNELCDAIGLGRYNIILNPLLTQSTKADAMKMDFIGRSVIQVTKENSFYEDIRNFFNGTSEEFADVDSFELTIKPRRKQNIEPAVKKVIAGVRDEGLDKMMIRAREEIGDEIMDVYLAGKGHVSDNIIKTKDRTIHEQIKEKIKTNSTLQQKVVEHESNSEFKKKEPNSFAKLHDADSWAHRISNL
ncbi:hypothetical protein [Abyssibacter profundi]|uniref:Uncharacterized protein n=1 Tax=Abyssibacter profundi TaxID=2182787 RepID=A0A363ULA1_9GAMM|nr:hypothetical protein [Abyssibacter profundi]PWN56200.1 hypothetical protein DEH80_07965 [Abyssibacter profundi]